MEASLQRLNAAVIDGRSQTPRYKQKQLLTFHDILVRESSNLHQALIKDGGCTSAEAWFEIHMTVQAVKDQYEAIKLQDCLDLEYSIARGKSNPTRNLPFECAYIVPHRHFRLYSIAQPAASAIAAGNCVIIEMENRPSAVDKILKDIIQQNMDKDTFVVVDQRPNSSQLPSAQTVILNADDQREPFPDGFARVLKIPTSSTVAIVDRSADIPAAARSIVRSQVRFSGKSSYAPNVVLVNEFAIEDFCQAAVKSLTEELSASEHAKPLRTQPKATAQKASHEANSRTLISTAKGEIELLLTRDPSILTQKSKQPRVSIMSISSLDDAIDFANSGSSPLLASYIFADAKAAKYLGQFIVSSLSLTNFIPPQLLVGPPAPQDYPVNVRTRFTTDMFSFPSPELIASSATASPSSSATSRESLEDAFLAASVAPKAMVEKLRASIQTPLSSMAQPSGKSIGFFEQGLFTGMAVHGLVTVSVLAVVARYAVPAVIRRF